MGCEVKRFSDRSVFSIAAILICICFLSHLVGYWAGYTQAKRVWDGMLHEPVEGQVYKAVLVCRPLTDYRLYDFTYRDQFWEPGQVGKKYIFTGGEFRPVESE
jgi:hypothetical protein